VAAAAYQAVFGDPFEFQGALIRDHARCIIELAAQDGVVPSEIDLFAARPPYKSEWPLTIPSEEDVDRYKESRKEYPRLYLSCFFDDFFTYTLSRLERYEHAVSRKEMARWVFNEVLEMGYGGEVLAGYDDHMIYRYGGGRGRPPWAERIGKKYQWIALNQLAARLADHVEPKEMDWGPQVTGIPLVYDSGRDIDPSFLATGRLPSRNGAVWWFPQEYDFAAVAGMSSADWAAFRDDLPSSEQLLMPLSPKGGRQWQLLEGYPNWSARQEDDDEGFTPHRQIWMHIRGYLVKEKSADRAFKWLSKQHFMGRWMEEGAQFGEGFVGEYPWGIPFTKYPDSWHRRGRTRKGPARLTPVCNSITSSYEEDAYQEGSINILVPARMFFVQEQLRWDGLSGYQGPDGRLRFLDPSLIERGKSALLVDREYLLEYLRREKLVLVWTVLGEKILIGDMGGSAPRLEFSRAHLLDHEGRLRSSEIIWK
jgi:hypothetical protein